MRAEAGVDFYADLAGGQQSKPQAQQEGDEGPRTLLVERLDCMVCKAPAIPTQFKDLIEDRPFLGLLIRLT